MEKANRAVDATWIIKQLISNNAIAISEPQHNIENMYLNNLYSPAIQVIMFAWFQNKTSPNIHYFI